MAATPYSHDNVRRGVLHYLLGRGMSAAAGFLTVILLVRHMEVAAYAAYTAILGFCVLAGMLSGLGMERALTRFIPEGVMQHPGLPLRRFIWWTSAVRMAILLLLVCILYAFWPALAERFAGLAMVPKFPLALAAVLASNAMFQLFSAVMQAMVQQKNLTRILVVQWAGRLVLVLAILSGGTGITLEQALWLMAVPDGIGTVILAWTIHKCLRTPPASTKHEQLQERDENDPWPPWQQVGKLSLNNYGYNLLAALPQGSSMIILAAALLAAPFVAVYGFYINLIERFRQYLPLQFMLNLAEPVLIASYIRDRDFARLCHHGRLLYKLNLLLLLPALAWLGAVAVPMTHILTGGKYTEHAWILPLLIAQIAVGSHATILQIIINAIGKSGILTVSGCSALVAMMLAIGLVLFSGEYSWLVVAPLVYEMVNNLAAVTLLGKNGWPYDLQWRFHAKLLLATAGAWAGALFACAQIASPLGQVLLAGVVVAALFCLSIALLRVVEPGELQSLRGILNRKNGQDHAPDGSAVSQRGVNREG
ncbi:oligosaccharide flippase family protein [Janthinobacterium sp. 17J80-10]|uniref:lipopolysaccharide biosynthesis protein n=1 Tax=Janthinobacterium sp. 17J80-10 TaxID=2497863 RepID=UPI0013E8F3BA|nr:oligosaccharide flippase family protein [Janthinobacterium sp. 17J80-10]